MMKRFGLVVAAVALACAANAWAGEKVRVGFSVSTFNDTFISNVSEAAKRFAAKHPEIELEMMDAQDDSVREQDQVVTLLGSGVDALVVLPVDSSSVAAIVQAAQEADKPLIFVNRNPFHGMDMPRNIYYVGANTLLEGEEQMRYIAKKLGGQGDIAIIMGSLSHEATQNRSDGVRRVVAEHPGIDGVRDATESVKAGGLAATVLQDSRAQGQGALEVALDLAQGKTPPQINLLPVEIITPENVDEMIKNLEQ